MVGKGLRGFVIGLIGSLPVLAVWAAVIAGLVFLIQKLFYRKKKKDKKEEPEEKTKEK